MIQQDVASGTHGGRVVTRFPPEPNGYLHIGHAKSICLNFGMAEEYGGVCHLRFDDTNPTKEETEYVESIQADIRWLGFQWGEAPFFASDYFERLYGYACDLIRKGKAYVCDQNEEEMRTGRGTVTQPGTDSPYRNRSVEENLALFEKMRAGEFFEGARTLRVKVDMGSPNMKMRDLPIYRILKVDHHRTGDAWCIYPLYDFAHCLSDSIEGITHSICTLEFENNRELYDWILNQLDVPQPQPQQTEFARLSLTYNLMSKRKLRSLVEDGLVDGWDDPRMPTLSGLRRRGYTPEAIRAFCERVGIARGNSTVDLGLLEKAIRDDLGERTPRVMCVTRPLKLVITNYPEAQSETFDLASFPQRRSDTTTRTVPFGREVFIEREDFQREPQEGFRRLAPGREVRLRGAYLVTCDQVIEDEVGDVVELRCTYDPASRGGNAPDGRKVRGTLHWVAVEGARSVTLRLYDRLFSALNPGDVVEGQDFRDHLNPDSLVLREAAVIEPSALAAGAATRFQFERQGYFVLDAQLSVDGEVVFNRVVGLKDSWASTKRDAPRSQKTASQAPSQVGFRPIELPALHPSEQMRADTLIDEFGLSESEARTLATDQTLNMFFEVAKFGHANPAGVARLLCNELRGVLKGRKSSEIQCSPDQFGVVVRLVDEGTISGGGARKILEVLVNQGGDAGVHMERLDLRQVSDEGTLAELIDTVIAAHADEVTRFRAGEKKLQGFFVGQVMKASRGKADPKAVGQLLGAKLSG
jgi:glutaminyl-tRNA synthetase